MPGLLTFFILLAAGLVFSEVFKRLDLPYVLSLIIGGIIIGPVLNILQVDETVSLMGTVGVIFLMFIAGSHVKLETFTKRHDIFALALLNGTIPFMAGFMICQAFGYGIIESLVIGVAFISSSIAVIIPALEKNKIVETRLGQYIISSTVLEDVGSLILLAVILQTFAKTTPLPLPVYIPLLIVILVVLKMVIPKVEKKYFHKKKGKDLFESELRFIFVVLLATVLLFEILGMHAIVAGFIIGILLSDLIKGKIQDKVHTISYGFFIPIFFIVMGVETNIFVFSSMSNVWLAAAIVTGLIASKMLSGWIGGRLLKFSKQESLLIGASTIPQLSTTLAVAFAALSFNIVGAELISSLVVLSVVTTFIAPIIIRHAVKRVNHIK